MKYAFCFTLDTEPDDLWKSTGKPKFKHIERLLDFHNGLVEAGARPTYLTTSEFAENDAARQTMVKILERGNAEIGAHFHTWTRSWPFEIPDLGNPPFHALAHQLGQTIEEQMLEYTCQAIFKAWERRPKSFRGGRWSLNGQSVISLRNCGITVDSTVTPGLSWSDKRHPFVEGPDFTQSIRFPHYLTGDLLTPSPHGEILEIPVGTADLAHRSTLFGFQHPLLTKTLQKCGISCGLLWLRPTIFNRRQLCRCIQELKKAAVPIWVAMIHSSEIIRCRYFKSESSVAAFWKRCFDLVRDAIQAGATAMTLMEAAEFYQKSLSQTEIQSTSNRI